MISVYMGNGGRLKVRLVLRLVHEELISIGVHKERGVYIST